jgi:AcrR family transcriptional regulator
MPTKEIATKIANHLKADDGRVKRTKDSRHKIVSAFLSLLRQGNISPSAEDIAKEASVGLRTVFRRFSEMELLYREVATEVQTSFAPEVAQPWVSSNWQEQLEEMLERKAGIYERMMPYSIAGKYLREHSDYLTEFNHRWIGIEHDIIASILPFTQNEEPGLFNALEVSFSNEAWLLYRTNHKLSAEQTYQAMRVILTSILHAYTQTNKDNKQ